MAKKRKTPDGRSELVRRDGALALTFVNTGSRRSPAIKHYSDLLAWAEQHGALTPADAQRLDHRANEEPLFADTGLAAAEDLYDILSQILNAQVDRQQLPAVAVDELNRLLPRVVPRPILAPLAGRDGLRWILPVDGEDLYRPLWAVAQSATALLTSTDLARVRRCAGENCDVLFLSKNPGPARKWCDINVCGAPVRSRNYYLRARREERRSRTRREF